MPIQIQNAAARLATGFLGVALAVFIAAPAQAFSLKVPTAVKNSFRSLLAQEGTFTPPPSSSGTLGQFQPSPTQSGPVSGSTGQFQQQPSNGQFGSNQVGPSQGQFGSQPSSGQFGQQPQGQFGNEQFQQVKEGVGPLRNDLNKFDNMVKDSERRGQTVSPQTKEKLQRSKETVNSVRRSENPEEMQNINTDQLESDVQDLEMERRRLEEEKRNLAQMKKGMLQMEKGLKQFEVQITRLARQKIKVPAEVSETLAKIKTVIAAIKAAKTFDEAEEAGMQDLPELFQSLDEFRHQLEALSRWPQVARQITQQVRRLDSELKRVKTTVDRLKRQRIDLTDEYTAFEAAVKKLKEVAGVASAKATSGNTEDVEEAFNLLENEFFGAMEEAFQSVQIIQTMTNLGRFNSDFRRGLAQAQQTINRLKRQKVDTAELQELYNEAKAKGEEVLALLRARPIDSEAIQEGLQELENLKQQFEEMAGEVSGEEEVLPWEQGKNQFQAIQLSPDISKLIPSKETATTPEL
ncbi:MAG: hypothetical protein AAB880_00060 [Patescibacteria group bacterium]